MSLLTILTNSELELEENWEATYVSAHGSHCSKKFENCNYSNPKS